MACNGRTSLQLVCKLYCITPFCLTVCQIENQLKRFCELEDVSVGKEELTDEKRKCDEHFERTHARHVDGKFLAQIPTHSDRSQLVCNLVGASRQLCWSERNRDHIVQPDYVAFVQEYEDLQHMNEVPNERKQLASSLPNSSPCSISARKLHYQNESGYRCIEQNCI